jgi:predicted lactoylglutathione lyase
MTRMTFVNLPVKDLHRTIEFFKGLGFSFNEQFSDENTACMVISDEAFAMLHLEPVFKEFTQQDITDTSTSREVLVGLSADSREEVDQLVDKAVASGGQAFGEPEDQGFMYMRAFRDVDGHQWSFIHMDMSAIPDQ